MKISNLFGCLSIRSSAVEDLRPVKKMSLNQHLVVLDKDFTDRGIKIPVSYMNRVTCEIFNLDTNRSDFGEYITHELKRKYPENDPKLMKIKSHLEEIFGNAESDIVCTRVSKRSPEEVAEEGDLLPSMAPDVTRRSEDNIVLEQYYEGLVKDYPRVPESLIREMVMNCFGSQPKINQKIDRSERRFLVLERELGKRQQFLYNLRYALIQRHLIGVASGVEKPMKAFSPEKGGYTLQKAVEDVRHLIKGKALADKICDNIKKYFKKHPGEEIQEDFVLNYVVECVAMNKNVGFIKTNELQEIEKGLTSSEIEDFFPKGSSLQTASEEQILGIIDKRFSEAVSKQHVQFIKPAQSDSFFNIVQ